MGGVRGQVGRWGGGNKEERKRGRQFANGTKRKKWCGPISVKDERRGEKNNLGLSRGASVSYRAGAKVVLKNTIINCHLHLRCKARE